MHAILRFIFLSDALFDDTIIARRWKVLLNRVKTGINASGFVNITKNYDDIFIVMDYIFREIKSLKKKKRHEPIHTNYCSKQLMTIW